MSAGAAPAFVKPLGTSERDSCTFMVRRPRGLPKTRVKRDVTRSFIVSIFCLDLCRRRSASWSLSAEDKMCRTTHFIASQRRPSFCTISASVRPVKSEVRQCNVLGHSFHRPSRSWTSPHRHPSSTGCSCFHRNASYALFLSPQGEGPGKRSMSTGEGSGSPLSENAIEFAKKKIMSTEWPRVAVAGPPTLNVQPVVNSCLSFYFRSRRDSYIIDRKRFDRRKG